MGGGASRAAALQPDEVSPHQAPPSFVLLIAAGRVVPDERDGPYMPDSFHANLIGANRGYRSREGRLEYMFTSKTNMARQKSWGTIDFEGKNAVDLEYMFTLGEINGKGVDLAVLRPVVIEAQRVTKTGYSKTFETARSKPGAAEAYERIAALPERRGKTRQSGGEQLDLVGLYKSALGAVGELWQFGQKAIRASGEAGVAASWSIKKAPLNPTLAVTLHLTQSPSLTRILNPNPSGYANQAQRIWFKLATEYGGDVSKVTDCARISLEFATAEGLERAAAFVLQAASTFKNRVANPTDEGYRDLLFTAQIGGHVCEVRVAPPPPPSHAGVLDAGRWGSETSRLLAPLSRAVRASAFASAAGAAPPDGDGQGQEERHGPQDIQALPARAEEPRRDEARLLPRGQ